jgi:hypothetical protein
MSHQYTIPPNDLVGGSEVTLETTFHGNWPSTVSNLLLTLEVNGTQRGTFQLASLAASVTFAGTVRYKLVIRTTGVSGTMNVHADGSVSDTTGNRAPTNTIAPAASVIGAAIDTTASNTIQLFMQWQAAGTGQSVTSDDSSLIRSGN